LGPPSSSNGFTFITSVTVPGVGTVESVDIDDRHRVLGDGRFPVAGRIRTCEEQGDSTPASSRREIGRSLAGHPLGQAGAFRPDWLLVLVTPLVGPACPPALRPPPRLASDLRRAEKRGQTQFH
jgi:hypothetical protein